jgi:hypothetical protein
MYLHRRWLQILCLLLVSCGGEGRLLITLDRPSNQELDPLNDLRLSKFSLRLTQDNLFTEQETYRSESADLQVGQVPVGAPFDLRLAGKTSTGEMLGLGIVLDVLVDGATETAVDVKFRKPMGYIAGGQTIYVLNASSSADKKNDLAPLTMPEVTDVAATPNGVLVLAAAGQFLYPIRTADHLPLQKVALPAPATCVAASPDSRQAVVCHSAEQSLSVVDLAQIGSGQDPMVTVPLAGAPRRVAFTKEPRSAWVLLGGIRSPADCAKGGSQLVEVSLEAPQVLQRIDLKRPAADVAVDPRDGTMLLALPCEGSGALGRLHGDQVDVSLTLPAPVAIGVTEQSIIVISPGMTSGEGHLVRYDLSKPGLSTPAAKQTFTLPNLEAFIGNSTKEDPGLLSWISTAQTMELREMAVAPDSQKALLAFEAQYASDLQFLQCAYETQIQVAGYLLVDLSSGEVIRHRFTKLDFKKCAANCLVEWNTGASLNDPAVCARVLRGTLQEQGTLVTPEFDPQSSTILFGG